MTGHIPMVVIIDTEIKASMHWLLVHMIHIYLPALFGLVLFSSLTSPVGAKLTHSLPVHRIKKCFAFLLLVVSIKMLLETI